MVDERFELLSLVFRLAGSGEYGDTDTEYQQTLESVFGGFQNHDAVKYAKKLSRSLGYDAVFKYAVHIEKDGEGFAFIADISSLVDDGRWTEKSAQEFLEKLNSFYVDTGFGAFYQANIAFYQTETQRFIENSYSAIDLEWFAQYVDSDNLRCVYAPSSSWNNYGTTVNSTIVYCAVSGEGSEIVHEYCHSFANLIAHKWYEENAAFKKWCDDTVDLEKLPQYGSDGKTIAGEYVTRAYNTLYYTDHGAAPQPYIYAEKGQGFRYIEDVYAMIAPYEKPAESDDLIADILGVGYTMGEGKTYTLEGRVIRWKVLSLEGPVLYDYFPTEVGNVFESSTGDVLYVEGNNGNSPYLMIDLGEATFQGMEGFRSYSTIPLD
jgi:hypothetical protein